MSEIHAEIASHTPQAGMFALRLFGGPWDGKEVGVRKPDAPFVRVNGPRHGDHSVWITHLYERREGHYYFVRSEMVPLSAWRINVSARGGSSNPDGPAVFTDQPGG